MAEHTPQKKLDRQGKRSEGFGPIVALTRYVKDDGRALLLYTHRHKDCENGNADNDADDDKGDGATAGRRS